MNQHLEKLQPYYYPDTGAGNGSPSASEGADSGPQPEGIEVDVSLTPDQGIEVDVTLGLGTSNTPSTSTPSKLGLLKQRIAEKVNNNNIGERVGKLKDSLASALRSPRTRQAATALIGAAVGYHLGPEAANFAASLSRLGIIATAKSKPLETGALALVGSITAVGMTELAITIAERVSGREMDKAKASTWIAKLSTKLAGDETSKIRRGLGKAVKVASRALPYAALFFAGAAAGAIAHGAVDALTHPSPGIDAQAVNHAQTPTATPAATHSPTQSPTPSATPEHTPTPAATHSPTQSPTPSATPEHTPTPAATPVVKHTSTPTPGPTPAHESTPQPPDVDTVSGIGQTSPTGGGQIPEGAGVITTHPPRPDVDSGNTLNPITNPESVDQPPHGPVHGPSPSPQPVETPPQQAHPPQLDKILASPPPPAADISEVTRSATIIAPNGYPVRIDQVITNSGEEALRMFYDNQPWRLAHHALTDPSISSALEGVSLPDPAAALNKALNTAQIAWAQGMLDPEKVPNLYRIFHLVNRTASLDISPDAITPESLEQASQEADNLSKSLNL